MTARRAPVLVRDCEFAPRVVRVIHAVPARGRPHIMQLRSPAPLNNKEPVLPRVVAPLNNTEPVLPPVVPLVVQQCVAVVTISWGGFVTLTGLKTRVSRRAEEKEEQAVAASQKLGAAGANFVLAIVSFATVLMFAFNQKENATSLGLFALAAVLAVVARQAAGAGSGGVASELVKLSQVDIITELPPILSSSVASITLLVTIITALNPRK